MNVEVLIATMNQTNYNLLSEMNIQTDAVIANQSDKYSYDETIYRNRKVRFYTTNETGVGLNRNHALLRAKGDISIIADDDLVYFDNYENLVIQEYKKNPSADIIIFNIEEEFTKRHIIKRKTKINFFNYMRYGAPRITFRTEKITKSGITFNIHFGGGTKHSAGEDVLFLTECLKKNLKIIAVPVSIAKLTNNRESTWFKGYTKKFFKDKGILYYYISKKFSYLLCLQFCIRRRKKFNKNIKTLQALKYMIQGIHGEKT